MSIEFHPVASLFPAMTEEEYSKLKESIRENGLREAIWLDLDGRIIDGRHRYLACQAVGAEPHFRVWDGNGQSLTSFIVDLNLHRRHLSTSQRAMIAAEALSFYEEEARQRQLHGLKQYQEIECSNCHNPSPRWDPADDPPDARYDYMQCWHCGYTRRGSVVQEEKEPVVANLPQRVGKARDLAGQALGVSGRTVDSARIVLEEGSPELAEAVKAGEVSVSRAAEEIRRGFDYKRDMKRPDAVETHTVNPRDLFQTPAYALDPLLESLDPQATIWEPAAGELNLVYGLYDAGYRQDQVVASDLLTGQNFFDWEPDRWDCLITNPPFSAKYPWIERCYRLGKPFALLLTVETLGSKTAQDLLQEYGFEMMLLDHRINFKTPRRGWEASGAHFPVFWLCWQLLPEQVCFGKIIYSEGAVQAGE